MTAKIKTIAVFGLFFLILNNGIKAQDRYEFAVIDYFPFSRTMEISINGTEYLKIKVEKDQVKGDGDVTAAIKEIDKMTKEGWELFNTNTVAGSSSGIKSYIFYLRKKIK